MRPARIRTRRAGRRGTAPTSRSGSQIADGMALERAVFTPEPAGGAGTSHAEWTAALEGGGTLMTSPIIWGAAAIFIAADAPEVQISKTITGETKTMTVVVEGIEQ